jgi:AcrR family transcriptional regulator
MKLEWVYMPKVTSPYRPDRRSQLTAIAADLFCARGYDGVSIGDIAAAAGISGPALYRHFPDKRAILARVLLSAVDDMETATARALPVLEEPSPERVESLLRGLAAATVHRRDVAALWRWEGQHLSPDDQREIARRSRVLLATWSSALLELRPDLTPADSELLCWAALSVFGSVAVHNTAVPKRQFVRLLVHIARRVLAVRLPPPPDSPAPLPSSPPPGTGTRPRREQLLGAAAELFRSHGFHAVSMETIGTATGIAGASIYRHFPAKAALLAAISRRAADRLMLGAEQALRTGANAPEALRRLAGSYVAVLTGSPDLAVALAAGRAHLTGQDRAEHLRVQRDYTAQWVSLLTAAQPQLSRPEARITVHAALTIANDLTRTRPISNRPYLNTELVTLMTAVLDVTQGASQSNVPVL